jgi:hypothetical protein
MTQTFSPLSHQDSKYHRTRNSDHSACPVKYRFGVFGVIIQSAILVPPSPVKGRVIGLSVSQLVNLSITFVSFLSSLLSLFTLLSYSLSKPLAFLFTYLSFLYSSIIKVEARNIVWRQTDERRKKKETKTYLFILLLPLFTCVKGYIK